MIITTKLKKSYNNLQSILKRMVRVKSKARINSILFEDNNITINIGTEAKDGHEFYDSYVIDISKRKVEIKTMKNCERWTSNNNNVGIGG